MDFKVLVTEEISEVGINFLKDQGYKIKMPSGNTEEIFKREVVDCHAILVRTAQITAEVLRAGKDLKVVSKHGVGLDNIDVEMATKLGIVVTNCPFSNMNSVAEHTIGLMINLAKNTLIADRELRKGDYNIRDRSNGMEIEGKSLGLIGIGKIGSLVAKKANRGFNMKVFGYDPFIEKENIIDEVNLVREWEDIFSMCDFISLHLPATSETKNIIGKKEFSLMKPTAFFINASRGEIVDEKSLIKALKEKQIAGAGLDVFDKEPPNKDNPLFKMDNVIVTPHNAALTKEARERMALHAAMGIEEVLSGKMINWAANII